MGLLNHEERHCDKHSIWRSGDDYEKEYLWSCLASCSTPYAEPTCDDVSEWDPAGRGRSCGSTNAIKARRSAPEKSAEPGSGVAATGEAGSGFDRGGKTRTE